MSKFNTIDSQKLKGGNIMSKFTKLISVTIVLVMLSALLTSCTKTPNATPAPSQGGTASPAMKPVKLRIAWQAGGARSELLQKFVKEYEIANSNVQFTIEAAESGKYQTKTVMDVAAGNTPDILTYWRPEPAYGVDKFIEKGALADLSELMNDPFFKDRYPEFAVKTSTVGGKTYGIPAEYAFIMFFANKDILDKCGLIPPQTYDELVNAIKVVKQKGYIPWAVSTKAFASGWERPIGYAFNRYISNKGEKGTLNAFAGKAPFNSPEAIMAAEHLHTLVAGNAAPDAMTLDDSQIIAKYLNTEKAAFFINGTYTLNSISKEVRQKMVALKWPDMPGAMYNGLMQDKDLVSVWYCSATAWKDPDKKLVLTDFIKTVTGDKAADRLLYEASSFVPDVKLTLDSTRVDRILIDAKKIADAGEQVKWPLSFAKPENKEPFYSVYTDFWSGKYTGKEFALKLQEIFYGK